MTIIYTQNGISKGKRTMTTRDKIKQAYYREFGVIAVDYDPSKPLPKARNKMAVEICDDGTVYEHAKGGISYIKLTEEQIEGIQ
jgi:hypothetical protein